MNKVSKLISSTIISLFESNEVGIVYNIVFDPKTRKCKYILVLDEENNIIYNLKFTDIVNFGSDCAYIKNMSKMELWSNFDYSKTATSPLNKKVYDIGGKYVGSCIDAEIDDSGNIENIILESMVVPSSKIINFGSVIIVGDSKVNINKYKPSSNIKTACPKEDKRVKILDNETSESNFPQNKIITDSRFLIGRKIIQDILAFNGELIARSGATITKDILNRASNYGKLVEVARYSTNK